MSRTLQFFLGSDLYEIELTVFTITSIRHWYAGGRVFRIIKFKDLPDKVKEQLIKKLKETK